VAHYFVSREEIIKRGLLQISRIGQIPGERERALRVAAGETRRQILTGNTPVQGRRDRQKNGVRPLSEKGVERGADITVVRQRMPAEHHEVERHPPLPVQLFRPAQNIRVRVALDAAVEELVSRGERIDQAGPAPAGAENYGI